MLDLRLVREEPDTVVQNLNRRGGDFGPAIREVLELDGLRRDGLTRVNALKARRNSASKEVGERKRAGEDAAELIAEMRNVGEEIAALDAAVGSAEERIQEILLDLPNLLLEEVPAGDESANSVVSSWGSAPVFDFEPRPHWELGEALGILDLPRGAKISGSGFPVLTGMGARLQRGLINLFLDRHTRENGYTELRVPYLVTRETLTGTGQLPKFADESYQSERDDLWLIPTAEVPVTNLHGGELLALEELPVRYTAYSPCFRREAGAAGKDTRGLLRVHQFDKVELVRYETPERSREALEELTREAEELLEMLGLQYRRVLLAAGDLGFSSAMTYDLEVFAPGVGQWLEVSSCSVFTDFQARRGDLRFRRSQSDRPEFVHTLNGSALALPRVVAALLETHQQADGSVMLPRVLEPYIGISRLEPAVG
ncbi:MAG: serine--tRNA ligase [Gemmatimonadales bacterium]|nr:MAG: serine--tRNA ligase [Gemmatimonadales bacterium]